VGHFHPFSSFGGLTPLEAFGTRFDPLLAHFRAWAGYYRVFGPLEVGLGPFGGSV